MSKKTLYICESQNEECGCYVARIPHEHDKSDSAIEDGFFCSVLGKMVKCVPYKPVKKPVKKAVKKVTKKVVKKAVKKVVKKAVKK